MNPLSPLIQALSRLPGIGEKSATRLALHIFRDDKGLVSDLIKALTYVQEKVRFCQICQNLTEEPLCPICRDPQRNQGLICIVQEPVDVIMIEKTGDYHGLYHVLQGSLSPLEGIGPEDIHIQSLIDRIRSHQVSEIILAMNPNVEGEATALYLKKILSSTGIPLTRIASGVPVGGTLEYTDAKTLARAMGNRKGY